MSFREILEHSLKLARRGEESEAIRLLEGALSEAIRQSDATWIKQLARNAAIMSDNIGNLGDAERYYRVVAQSDHDSPVVHFALDSYTAGWGNSELSTAEYSECWRLATNLNDEETLELLRSAGFTPD